MSKGSAIASLVGLGMPETREAEGYVLVDYDSELTGRADNRDVDMAAVRRLADSIEADGLGQPILCREVDGPNPPFELIAGQHRCAAYRLLAERHPDDPRWRRIDAKVCRGMDDRTARRLMFATNVVNAELSQAERGAMLEELYGAQADAIKRESGGRRRDIIRDLFKEETGKPIGVQTVQRALKARSDEEKARASRVDSRWAEAFEKDGLRPEVQSGIASMSPCEQASLWIDYAGGRNRTWLADEVRIRTGSCEPVVRRAMGMIEQGISLLRRCDGYRAGSVNAEILRAANLLMEIVDKEDEWK